MLSESLSDSLSPKLPT